MRTIIGWTVFGGLIWFFATFGITLLAVAFPEHQNQGLEAILTHLRETGESVGHFMAPILQLALIVVILIAAAEHFGLTGQGPRAFPSLATLAAGNNVQAFIAVVVVVALVIGALADVRAVGVLKDIALVVVGFYFGSRRRQTEIEDAVAVGTAAGIAAGAQSPAVSLESPSQSDPIARGSA